VSAVVPVGGTARSLDVIPEPAAPVTERDVQEPTWLARTLVGLLRDIAIIKGRWRARPIDFRDLVSDGTDADPASLVLHHGLGGLVNWWPVRMRTTDTVVMPLIEEDTAKTSNGVLVLKVYFPCVVTMRVEKAG
jgi:hypothetical protein